jgi:hypothetical protein
VGDSKVALARLVGERILLFHSFSRPDASSYRYSPKVVEEVFREVALA